MFAKFVLNWSQNHILPRFKSDFSPYLIEIDGKMSCSACQQFMSMVKKEKIVSKEVFPCFEKITLFSNILEDSAKL